jgi:mitochondrial enoyl-[acyl-carrier protein] reductase / trans-2-enoyl-CoA reductase
MNGLGSILCILFVVNLERIPLDYRQMPEPQYASRRIHIRFLASPVNPSDLNQIEGVYPLKATRFPAIAGNEGVARVVDVLDDDPKSHSDLAKDDLVIPSHACFGTLLILAGWCFYRVGTWRQEAICYEADLYKLPTRDVSLKDAAMLQVNPCTAYRMLHDFEDIKGLIVAVLVPL